MADRSLEQMLASNDIDLIIGEELLAQELHGKEYGDEEKRSLGRRWFQLQIDKLREIICSNPSIQKAASVSDPGLLAAAVLDALVQASTSFDIPVTVLAAKVLQVGVDRICRNYTQNTIDESD